MNRAFCLSGSPFSEVSMDVCVFLEFPERGGRLFVEKLMVTRGFPRILDEPEVTGVALFVDSAGRPGSGAGAGSFFFRVDSVARWGVTFHQFVYEPFSLRGNGCP